ncbi:MAG: ABC transporter permease [Saccharofermentanales bacterium]
MLAGMTGPLFLLYGKAVIRLLFRDDFGIPPINAALFVRSIGICIASTILCTAFGALSALFVWSLSHGTRNKVFYALLICALIPPFIHVHSWIKAVDFLNGIILGISGIGFNFTGTGAVIWTTALSYLPFAAILFYLGLRSIPAEVLELTQMEGHPFKVFSRIVLPYTVHYTLIGFIFVFLITINDYSIASVFGVSVYALELFALFSAGGDIYAIAFTALPLIGLAAGLMLLISFLTKDRGLAENFTRSFNPFTGVPSIRRAAGAGGLILFVFASVPVIAMAAESFHAAGFFRILKDSAGQIAYSFFISVMTAFLAVIPATLYAYVRSRSGGRRVVVFLLAFPFLIPSAILGLSLIAVWNNGILSAVYTSAVMPAVGLAARFGILAILYMSYRFERIDRDLTDAVRMDYSASTGFFRVVLPMIRQDVLACLLMVFALSMGEYGIVLLLTPPGYQMVTIKIYNYIHYGASEIVFALNLTIFLSILLAGLLLIRLIRTEPDAGQVQGASSDDGARGIGG